MINLQRLEISYVASTLQHWPAENLATNLLTKVEYHTLDTLVHTQL